VRRGVGGGVDAQIQLGYFRSEYTHTHAHYNVGLCVVYILIRLTFPLDGRLL